METCCEYTDSVMWVSTDERRMITRMMKLIAEHPDETEIIKRPEENDGCLYCKVPSTWLKIAPPVKREMSDEQKAAASQRMQKLNEQARLSKTSLWLPLIIAPKPSTSSPPTQSFEKKRNSSALFAREINLVTQPSFDCEQGINSQVQTVCSNADAVFSVLGIVFCKNERFSLSRKTHVPLWNEPRISHVRLL